MRTVICYDIADDKGRRRVVKALEGVGFRVQYSVFEADLSNPELARLMRRLEKHVKSNGVDSIRFYPLEPGSDRRVQTLGRDLTPQNPLTIII